MTAAMASEGEKVPELFTRENTSDPMPNACPSETRCLSKSRRHFDGFRRGGFFAPSDLMMRLPFPLDGNGTLA